jgi:hypothetical protein
VSLPWHFFVVNDGSILNPILPMRCVICHFFCQSYSVGKLHPKGRKV